MVDLLTTTISMLIPIITMSIYDSVLRFVMDKNYDKQAVLVNSFFVILIGISVLLIFHPLLVIIVPFDNYMVYFYFLILIQSINTTLNQFVRAKGLVKLFAANGIINALILLICNIFFLILFSKGIEGYLLSFIIANLFSSLFVYIAGKVFLDFKLKKLNITVLKEMLLYSIPLIPNALMWWIMELSDRYIITFFLGLSANGIYAVASKIPGILNIVNSIFFQAWQMSAIEESESQDKSVFFSTVFNVFSIAMLVSTSLILTHLKFIIDLILAENYYETWKYIPFLLLAVVFSSFSGFLGTNYIAAKKTFGVFKTSLVGAILNILANFILIPIIGIYGAAIGTIISFIVIWLLRIKDTKMFVNIEINIIKLLLNLLVICTQITLLYLHLSYEYLFQLGLSLIIIAINFYTIKDLALKIIKIITKKHVRSDR